jgi:hypothetical protein
VFVSSNIFDFDWSELFLPQLEEVLFCNIQQLLEEISKAVLNFALSALQWPASTLHLLHQQCVSATYRTATDTFQ